jgi:predicted nucleic acid-binding protein
VTLVVDASLVVAALVDGGDTGAWAESLLAAEPLSAPHLMPVEAANILRRAAGAGRMAADSASLAHVDLLDLRVQGVGTAGHGHLLRRLVRGARRVS